MSHMLKKVREKYEKIILEMGLVDRSHRRFFKISFIIFTVYVWFVIYGQWILSGSEDRTVLWAFLIGVIPVLFFLVIQCGKFKGIGFRAVPAEPEKRVRSDIKVFLATAFVCALWMIAFYPGVVSPDSIEQYMQVLNGKYSNWHPVLHTWLIFWIPMQISQSLSAIIIMQLLYFSLTVTYLIDAMKQYHCSNRIIFLSWLFIIMNPNTMIIMLYPWKDSALSIAALLFFAQLVRVYNSDGAWLTRKINLLAFSLVAFAAAWMRHNSILLVVPVYIILMGLKKARRQVIASALIFILFSIIWNGPVLKVADVQKPAMRNEEISGLTMTILSGIYVNDPEALDPEAREFMDSLADREQWDRYFDGTYNTIKWSGHSDLIAKVDDKGAAAILQYAVNASRNDWSQAVRSFVTLTHMVWGVDSAQAWKILYQLCGNQLGIRYMGNIVLEEILLFYQFILQNTIIKYLFCYLGIDILLMLCLFVGRIGRQSFVRLGIIFAPLVYDFGTMLLLSGHDFRFFHFNFLILVPILYIMLGREAGEQRSSDRRRMEKDESGQLSKRIG